MGMVYEYMYGHNVFEDLHKKSKKILKTTSYTTSFNRLFTISSSSFSQASNITQYTNNNMIHEADIRIYVSGTYNSVTFTSSSIYSYNNKNVYPAVSFNFNPFPDTITKGIKITTGNSNRVSISKTGNMSYLKVNVTLTAYAYINQTTTSSLLVSGLSLSPALDNGTNYSAKGSITFNDPYIIIQTILYYYE